MKLWSVHVEERRARTIQVAAPSEKDARQLVAARLSNGSKVLSANPDCAGRDGADAQAALVYLLMYPFIDIAGQPANVWDWIKSAYTANSDKCLYRQLSAGGLRVARKTDDCARFIVAVSSRSPVAAMYKRSPWSRCWRQALKATHHSTTTIMTFAGYRSRAVSIPWWVTEHSLSGGPPPT